jgi:hypothetical protein
MRRENQALQARLAALEARQAPAPAAPSTPTPAAPAAPGDQAPQPEQFATHQQYVQAVAQWTVEQHQRAQAQQAAHQQVQTAWEQQEAKAKAKYSDYDEALASDPTRYHPAVLHALQTSELGAEVAYHLATHPEEAQRIAALPPAHAVRALGKLEARLEAPTATNGSTPVSPAQQPTPDKTPTPTPKPRPMQPVGGTGSAGSTKSPEQMDYDEYTRWYTKTYGGR